MSARPRPVTATFKPASMAPAVGVRTRSYSLSSGTSTASLVSVLDHDSYESLPDSDEESPEKQTEGSTVKEQAQRRKSGDRGDNKEWNSPDECPPSPTHELTPWEKWRLNKIKQEDEKKQQEERRIRKEKQEKERIRKEKAETQRRAEEKFKEWLDKKTVHIQTSRKQEARRSKSQAEIEEEKKAEVEKKSQEKFDEWMAEKKKRENEEKKAEKEKKKKDEQEKEERKKRCEEKFEEWCKQAVRRPKSAHSGLGYASGKLTGYYDKTAPPPPSFYNPIPWQPIPMPPEPKPAKKKSARSAKKWNPMKYL